MVQSSVFVLVSLFLLIKEKSAAVEVRLVDGKAPNKGRVEVRTNSTSPWNIICDNDWGYKEAHVICHMLNYPKALLAGSHIVNGSGPIYPYELSCDGSEEAIDECALGPVQCMPYKYAVVTCGNLTTEENEIKVRLVGTNASHVGQVELKYQGMWGAVCADTGSGWDIKDAHVICRMLGYKAAETAIRWMKGEASVKRLVTDVRCRNNEASFAECYHGSWWNVGRCQYWTLAGVVCQAETDPPPVQVRLSEGANSGRVEVRYHGVWGMAYYCGWDKNDAQVVCRMLGYPGVLVAKRSYSSSTLSVAWLRNVDCKGSEMSIVNCSHSAWGKPSSCDDVTEVGVKCKTGKEIPFEIRLVDGKTPRDGRVEVRENSGPWRTICNDWKWDMREAFVVCHMLNYSKAVSAGIARVKGSGHIYPNSLECDGSETSVELCRQRSFSCSHNRDAAVECGNLTAEEEKIKVRLQSGINAKYFGRVEILYNGTWGAVCPWSDWNVKNAHVICRMLGYKAAENAIRWLKGNSAMKFLLSKVACSGKETSIAECYHTGWWNVKPWCRHFAGVVCQPDLDPPPVQVRLSGGASDNSGRVEVRYHGVWGTVCLYEVWPRENSEVVCRMLGYPGVVDPSHQKFTPINKGSITPIWLTSDDFACTGTEMDITYCNPVWGQASCGYHDNDIGVTCQNVSAPRLTVTEGQKCTVELKISHKEKELLRFYKIEITKQGSSSSFLVVGSASKFVVGDGRYYSGVYNAPLESGTTYTITVRAVNRAQNGGSRYGETASKTFRTNHGECIRRGTDLGCV